MPFSSSSGSRTPSLTLPLRFAQGEGTCYRPVRKKPSGKGNELILQTASLALCALLALASCAKQAPPLTPPSRPEDKGGVFPVRGVHRVGEGIYPVRLALGDMNIAFFLEISESLGLWLAQRDGAIDFDRGLLLIPGQAPVALSNIASWPGAREIVNRQWLFSAQVGAHGSLLGDPVCREDLTEATAESLGVAFPEGLVLLTLEDNDATSPWLQAIPGALGGLMGFLLQKDEMARLSFLPDPALAGTSEALEEGRRSLLRMIDDMADHEILLQNMHGFLVDQGAIPSLSDLRHITRMLCRVEGLHWDRLENGCQDRALMMSQSLVDLSIHPTMVFVYGQDLFMPQREDMDWTLHVATGFFVEDDDSGAVDLYMVDFALADHLLPLDEWLASFIHGPVVMDFMPHYQWQPSTFRGLAQADDFRGNLADAWWSLNGHKGPPQAPEGP